MDEKERKILVAYFSHRGQNYCNGRIVDLTVGNTESVAKKIAEKMEADLFEIRAVKKYPITYYECTEEAQAELRANSRPVLTEDLDISGYDVIFLGYPNWWGTMPMPIWNFLESHDFSGKTIHPFCTHEGSGMGNSERDLKKICPAANLKKGLAIRGSEVKNAEKAIQDWIK